MVIALTLAAAMAAAPPQADATKILVSAPTTIVEIDAGKLKGDLMRLAWAPDGAQVYLQTAEPDTRGNVKLRYFVLGLDGSAPKSVNSEPPWATTYWAWKSSQAAPGRPALKIQVDQQSKRVNTTSTPMGGNLARGDAGGAGGRGGIGGLSTEEAAGAAQAGQNATIVTLRLKGEVVGEFVNAVAIPGVTFSWGPQGSGLIAFVRPGDRAALVLMDDQNRKQEIALSNDASLPAWTADGKRLAYLERTGRKKLTLRILDLTVPQ